MEVRIVKVDAASGLWYRHETNDRFIIDEAREVYAPLPVNAGDVALDLGAHIGTASRLLLERGASLVVAVEADPGNVDVLRRNLEGRTAKVIAAAVGAKPGTITFYANPDRPYLSTTLADEPGRDTLTVPVVALEDLLATYQPAIVKCDIEFGEYDLPELTHLPRYVRVLAMELHVRPDLVLPRREMDDGDLRTKRQAAADTLAAIEAQGFRAIRRKDKQAKLPPEIHDQTGLRPLTKSIDAIWVRP